jgi:DNA-binding response OmpR family regulator
MPTSPPVIERKVVLLVEDNIDALAIYGSVLRHAGYDVREAPTLKAAKDAVDAELPAVVVLDCRLPDGDGIDLLERWRTNSATMKDIPVIVLTASGVPQDVQAAFLAGADQFVLKPCVGDALATYVARALDDSHPSARLRRVSA